MKNVNQNGAYYQNISEKYKKRKTKIQMKQKPKEKIKTIRKNKCHGISVPKTSIGKLKDLTNSTHSACPFNDKLKQPNRSPENS